MVGLRTHLILTIGVILAQVSVRIHGYGFSEITGNTIKQEIFCSTDSYKLTNPPSEDIDEPKYKSCVVDV